MRTISLAVLAALLCANAQAKCNLTPIKIAVIDTGFGYQDKGHEAKLCRYGHKDFSSDRQFSTTFAVQDKIPLDTHGHGTNIAGIIDGYIRKTNLNYCLVIIKFYSESQTGAQNLTAESDAIRYATNIGVDYINFSGGGPERDEAEYQAFKRAFEKNIQVIAAVGNDSKNIDQYPYYPASYNLPNMTVVGNEYIRGHRATSSNYGSSVRWEVGTNVTAYGITMTGSSQATAVFTGKLVASSEVNKCDIGSR